MKEEIGGNYLDKNSLKLKDPSYINEHNKKERLSNIHLPEDASKIYSIKNTNNLVTTLEIVSNKSIMKKSLFTKNTSLIRNNASSICNPNTKSLINNNTNYSNLGFIPHFGKSPHKTKTNSNTVLNNILNNESNNTGAKMQEVSGSIINNNNIIYDLNSPTEDSIDNEKNLKMVEKEIKNKIMDMSYFMQEDINRSLVVEHKKNLDIFSIEEEPIKRKRKKRKIKKKEENFEKDRAIIRKKALYDSLDEEEDLQEDEDSDFFIINPEGKFAFILDSIVLVLSLISFLYIPLQISFSKCFCIEETIYTNIIFLFIDVAFILDFFSSFFKAFYNYEYKLIKEIKPIIQNYLKGKFFIELLQAIPFNLIIIYLCHNKEKFNPDGPICFYNGINGTFASIKLCSLIKISKVLKAMNKKYNRAYLWLSEIDNHSFEKVFNLLSFLLLSLGSINVFICVHVFIGYQTYPNWIISMGIQDKSFIQVYISALYGIIEALTTVGYGDVVCNSFTEIIFQIILLSVGIVAYSWLITIIGNHVKNESKLEIKHSKDLTLLEEIRIEFPKMNFKLYKKIQQHLRSVSNQQKKIDLNILVNSLPYSIKNMVLFKVYNKCIKNFIFFKKCDNTDFISRVLTNFIPLFSMKKAFLIREGELVENIYFVKTGKLSLFAALDIDNPEDSIKRYIYEKFEDIMGIENNNNKVTTKADKENTLNNNTNTIKNSGFQNIENFFNQKNKIINQSYHESRIEKEIGKCDYGGNDEEKLEKLIRIMDINKNENFGTTYMLLNKPSPLSLRVVSKKVDIFLLRKSDAFIISKAYSSIWKKITEKALTNMIAIKDKTIKTLKNYCSYNGILLDDKIPEKNRKLDLNLFEIKELIEIERKKQKEEKDLIIKKKATRKKTNKFKSIIKKPLIKSNSVNLKKNEVLDKIKKKLVKKFSPENTNLLFVKPVDFKCSFKNNYLHLNATEYGNNLISKSKTKLSNYKIENSSKIINNLEESKLILEKSQKESSNNSSDSSILEETNNLSDNITNNSYPNTLNNLSPAFASFLKKKIEKKKYKNKKYYKLMCMQLIEKLNNIINNNSIKKNDNNIKIGNENSNNIINANNCQNSIYKNNNYYIYNSNIIFPFSDDINKNKDLISSLSKISQSNIFFDSNKLSINKSNSFEIKSIYNNLNSISDGKYEKNYKMQKDTEEYIKTYFKSSPKTEKIKNGQYNFSSLLDDNISEIKSNSFHGNDNKKESKDIHKSLNTSKKKNLKKMNSPKKGKKVKFYNQNANHINTNIKNIKANSNKNKDSSSLSIYNNSHNSLNNIETSDKKMNKDKNIKISGSKIVPNTKNKSKTFIKKIFKKQKTKKENNSGSKSNDILKDLNLNHENELRNINYEESKEKALYTIDNKDKKNNEIHKEEIKNTINENEDKNNNNCIIF